MKTITARELRQAVDAATAPTGLFLIHVLPQEVFVAQRIAGSQNVCVYETSFVAKMRELVPDTSTPVVVYGEGDPSLDSAAAAEKLVAAGYTQVTDFRGGLQEWVALGFSVESNGSLPTAPTPDGIYRVDLETSLVRWTGRNLFNHHHGRVQISDGKIVIEAGHLLSAEFTLDMAGITCDDLTDSKWNALLIHHLRNEDFFAVDRFPVVTFTTTKAEAIADATPGTPNFLLHGELTLRGVTRPLTIPTVIAAADASHLTGQAQIEIDRTEFGSIYGSGKWFAFLGKHVVNDRVQLHLKINAERAS